MGFLDDVKSFAKDPLSTIRNKIEGGVLNPDDTDIGGVFIEGGLGLAEAGYVKGLNNSKRSAESGFLVVNPKDWYKLFPFTFQIQGKGSSNPSYTYTLPIPPESITTKMIVASEATPTLGGVVEETSMNKFWMVQLTGTTGMAVGRDGQTYKKAENNADKFREVLSTTGLLSGLGANINSGGSRIAGLINQGSNIYNADSLAAGAAGVAGIVGLASQPVLPYASSAVDKKSNGYSEMARIHKFFFMYSFKHENDPTGYSLYFINHKDGQKFRCVLKDFSVQKSSQEPHLYRYRIALKCWEPTAPSKNLGKDKISVNRFDPAKGDLKTVNTLNVGNFAKINESFKSLKNGKIF
ncbi:hypothetical protein UFOVP244_173 [uncultured Caudovirales phage]|uniref:Uncharacterized protein n=1 Tax=uncultured Caudovirales phage TaxID=2100421 RepID=A0A6J7WXM6_9CAUD|nr:hypothetical protein UFOVP244_173 [uncultured Caudovirales phage]